MNRQQLDEIIDRIHEECGSDSGELTGHGSFVANMARRVFAGEEVNIEDSGLELFGLEQFIN